MSLSEQSVPTNYEGYSLDAWFEIGAQLVIPILFIFANW